MSSILLVIEFILAILITISVLLQKSSSIGLGAYSGSNESMFGAKGPAGFLAKFTAILTILFIINTVGLGYTYKKETKSSLMDNINTNALQVPQKADTQKDSVPQAPVIPQAPTK